MATAVPTLPTTTPAASRANSTASASSAPQASATPSAASVVSPAPVTSNTVLGSLRKWRTPPPRTASDMPWAARVTRIAPAWQVSSAAMSAASISASVRTGRSTVRDSSRALGLITAAGPYLAKLRPLGSTTSRAPAAVAASPTAAITFSVAAPLA